MQGPAVLQLEGVGRRFPADVGESAAALWREMLLPRRWLGPAGAHDLQALDGIDLTVHAGQCVGVLGTHRSGKSTLAGIAAGILAPTAGRVVRPRRCVLVARPTAGFKPGLTVRENLGLLGTLHGLHAQPLDRMVEAALARWHVGAGHADAATGNLSPHVVRLLALTLLLELPCDLLVIDGLSAAGTGDARWTMRDLLRERLAAGASLILSADPLFLQEVATYVHVLERGRLAASFQPAIAGPEPIAPQPPSVPWQLLGVQVDGHEWRHGQASLIRRPGERLRVVLALRATRRQRHAGGCFELHGGTSGATLARCERPTPATLVQAGEQARLCFDLRVPDAGEDFCGLSFTPADPAGNHPPAHRLKVLVYGVGRRHASPGALDLEITRMSFEPERNASHGTEPDLAPAPGHPAARQAG